MNHTKHLETRKPNYSIWTAFLAVCAIILVLTLLSPSEKTLGDLVKLVYVHGAVVWGALVMFAVSAVLGLISLFSDSRSVTRFSFAAMESGIIFWLLHILLSVVVTWASWGGIFWSEPRFQMAFYVAGGFVVIYPAVLFFRSRLTTGALAAALGVFVFGLLIISGKIMHPQNPIGSSDSFAVQAYFTGLVVFTVLASALLTVLLSTSRRAESVS